MNYKGIISGLVLTFCLLIGVKSQTFTFLADTVSGPNSTLIDVPIRVRNCTQILSMQGTVSWNPTIASFNSVSVFGLPNFSIGNFGTTQTGTGRIAFSWDDVSLLGLSLPNNSIIFTLRFLIVGAPTNQTPVSVDNSLSPIEVVNLTQLPIAFLTTNGHIYCNGPAPACAITGISAGTQTSCVPASNSYTQAVTVTYSNAPVSGNLQVNGQFFPITSSPQTVTLTNLVSNGQSVNVSTNFSGNPTCSFSQNNLFTAPASCAPGGTFRFFADSVVGPTSNILDVNVRVNNFNQILSCQGSITWDPAVASFSSISGFGLPSMAIGNFGTSQTSSGILAFSWDDLSLVGITEPDSHSIFTIRFILIGGPTTQTALSFGNSPTLLEVVNLSQNPILTVNTPGHIYVTGACAITGITVGNQTNCVTATNAYTQQVTVTYNYAPVSGSLLVAGQSFAITSSPQTVTLANLQSTGQPVNVSSSFSTAPTCSFTHNNLFTAPVSCGTGTNFVFLADSGQGSFGSILDIPIRVKNFNQILSIQGTVEWNTAIATFNSISYMGLAGMAAGNFGTNQTNNGKLAFSWDDVSQVGITHPDSTIIFTIRFNLIGSPGNQTALTFSNSISTLEVVNITQNPISNISTNGNVLISGGCNITGVSIGTQTACNPLNNTYTQNVTVTYTNPPGLGSLVLNGQSFAITTSPQTVTMTGLYSNGQPVNLNTSFSGNTACFHNLNSAFNSPSYCGLNPVFTYFADSVQGPQGTYVVVPVRVLNFEQILSCQGTMEWNTSVASFDSITYFGLPGMAAGNFGTTQINSGRLAFSWDDASLLGLTIPDSTIIFSVQFFLNGTTGNQTPVSFGNSITTVEIIDTSTNSIVFNTINGQISISGASPEIVGWCHSALNDSIRYVKVKITGTLTDSVTTNTHGDYGFYNLPPGGTYTVTPTKNNDVNRVNGITALDAALIKRHVLNITFLNSPYKIMAGDVNGSNTLTALDAALVKRFVLGLDTMFVGAKLWRFLPEDHVFSDTANPWTPSAPPTSRTHSNLISALSGQDFIGLKLGDVNASWSHTLAKVNEIGNFEVAAGMATAKPNQIVSIPFVSKKDTKLGGYQFTIRWNPAALELVSFPSGLNEPMFGDQDVKNGMLTVLWTDENGMHQFFKEGTALFALKFKVKEGALASNEIMINSDFTPLQAFNENLDLLKIVPGNGAVLREEEANEFTLFQNYPNPFSDNTQIRFYTPQNGKINFTIRNLQGSIIQEFSGEFEAGVQEWNWDGKSKSQSNLISGYYFIEAESGSTKKTIKSILLNP